MYSEAKENSSCDFQRKFFSLLENDISAVKSNTVVRVLSICHDTRVATLIAKFVKENDHPEAFHKSPHG